MNEPLRVDGKGERNEGALWPWIKKEIFCWQRIGGFVLAVIAAALLWALIVGLIWLF